MWENDFHGASSQENPVESGEQPGLRLGPIPKLPTLVQQADYVSCVSSAASSGFPARLNANR
jgi:hypothetical protein